MAKYSLEPDGQPGASIDLNHVVKDTGSWEQEETVLNLIGRGRKVDRGTDYGLSGTLTCHIYATATQTVADQLGDIENLRSPGCDAIRIRDAFGLDWKASITGMTRDRSPAGETEYLIVQINYVEVA